MLGGEPGGHGWLAEKFGDTETTAALKESAGGSDMTPNRIDGGF